MFLLFLTLTYLKTKFKIFILSQVGMLITRLLKLLVSPKRFLTFDVPLIVLKVSKGQFKNTNPELKMSKR